MKFTRIETTLPDINALRADAKTEGHQFIERLVTDWSSGSIRFDKPGEALLGVREGDAIVAIGGVTQEPSLEGALRMRRFYVRPAFRRQSIGWTLVRILVDHPSREGCPITVHAGTPDATKFWEALSFATVTGQPYSHVLKR
ncbi:MAG TPA: GNAT family N-acetyltransferase [Devosiaceae bacterium]|jgi:GNAT superfamily N-acetyltransferase